MTESRRKLISVVVPVLNEEDNVRRLYKRVRKVLTKVKDRYDYEFIFTDNHSEDGTFEVLAELAASDPRVRAFRFSRNFGFQRSILTGYVRARGDVAIQLDCDLQDPPELLLTFLEEWEAGHKIVYGVRRNRREGALITFARRVFYRLIDALSEDALPHDAGDFRLIDRKVIDELAAMNDHKPYLRGTLAVMGFEQKGVPYDRSERRRGESKFRLRDLIGLALDGILSHSIVPLRMATYTGLVVSVLTVAGIAFYLVGRVAFGADWPPGFATTSALILLTLSLNSLFLGVIGEYVGRIYHQVRRRPVTIVERAIDAPPNAQAKGD
jgi:dolichol-phosphate mannosyltransferase